MSMPSSRTPRPNAAWILVAVLSTALCLSTLPIAAAPAGATRSAAAPAAYPAAQWFADLAASWGAWLDGLRGSPSGDVAPTPAPAWEGDGSDEGGGIGRVTGHGELGQRKMGPSLDPNGSA